MGREAQERVAVSVALSPPLQVGRATRQGERPQRNMHLRPFKTLWLALGIWMISPMARADSGSEPERWRGYLHANGYTYHFAAPGTNDKLFGTGITWYTRKWARLQTAWEADAFQDSEYKLSGYVGRSLTLPLRLGSVGATGALMYHRNFVAQNRYRVLPVVLPFAETRVFRQAKVRVYYIPPVRNRCDEQICMQLLIPFAR
jgi:hypothetical protein